MRLTQPILISIICSISLTAWAEPIPVSLEHNNLRMTYETLALPEDEAMGLIGLNYQQMFGLYWYGGLGVYGAAVGERGGFFTGGFEGGLRYPLVSNFESEMGVFIGGGGGGAAPQGGGLMIRPHVGITYGNDAFRVGLQLSRIEFPNGDIKSDQITGVVDIPFESFLVDGKYRGKLDYLPYDVGEIFHRSMKSTQGKFGVELQHYTPARSSLKTDGSLLTQSFDTVGVRYESFLSHNISWYVTAAGAMGGSADGYAEIFSGMGWRYGVFDSVSTKSRLFVSVDGAIGMGGGGKIATGGGTMGKASAGLSYLLNPQWSVDARSGYVQSVDGDFNARLVNLSLNYTFMTIHPSAGTYDPHGYSETLIRRDWRLRPLYEMYASAQRKEGSKESVSLIGMQIDTLISDNGYLYAKALGACSGDAGGYALGSIGAGVNYPLPFYHPIQLYTQVGAGAAGGGGINVGSGLIVEVETGMSVNIAANTDIFAGVGMIHGVSGELETPTYKLGLAYKFGTLGSKHSLY